MLFSSWSNPQDLESTELPSRATGPLAGSAHEAKISDLLTYIHWGPVLKQRHKERDHTDRWRDTQMEIFVLPKRNSNRFPHKAQLGSAGTSANKSCALGSFISLIPLGFSTSSRRNRIKAYTKKILRGYAVRRHYFLYFKAHENIGSSQSKLLNCTVWLMAPAEESIPACAQPQARTQGPVIQRGTNCFPSSGLLSESAQGMRYISNSTWLT